MSLLLLYIDPGTGSILFSLIIGLVTTLYFVAKQAFLRLKMAVLGASVEKTSATRQKIVVYSEGNQYWNVFKPVLDELERLGVETAYLTSAENDPFFGMHYTHLSGEYIGKGNKAFARLNFLEADVCLMTTPGLDVYQLKRSRGVKHYAHILHMVDEPTSYRLFGLDYYDSILLSGEFQIASVRELEKKRGIAEKELYVVGCTYLDELEKKAKSLPREDDGGFTVLVAPSWGESGLLVKYGERLLDPLVGTGYRVIIRPHPQSYVSETAKLEFLSKRYKDATNVEWDSSSDNVMSLSRADVMISDFSGVIFDYTFLFDRPFLYLNQEFDNRPYDSFDLDETPWKFRVLPEIGRELVPSDFKDIGMVLKDIVSDSNRVQARKRAREMAWQFPGEAGKRTARFIASKAGQ